MFDIIEDSFEKAQGYAAALITFSEKTLELPRFSYQLRLDYENVPEISGLADIVRKGRWWDELYNRPMN